MIYDFQWEKHHIVKALSMLGYENLGCGKFQNTIETWVLPENEDAFVLVPLKQDASDYQRLCDRSIRAIAENSLESLESMQRASSVLMSIREKNDIQKS